MTAAGSLSELTPGDAAIGRLDVLNGAAEFTAEYLLRRDVFAATRFELERLARSGVDPAKNR